jgi:predicted acylesterase/phospholipase RssA
MLSKLNRFKGLALEGGGVCGLAYRPSLNYLNMNQFKVFAGSSAGSLMAGMLACRATSDQIDQALQVDFRKFKDNSWFPVDLVDFFRKYGWYNGDYLLQWYRNWMARVTGNPDITFKEAHQRFDTTLIITKTDVLYPFSKLVAMDYQSHPNHSIAAAVRESVSIPYLFEAVPGLAINGELGHWFVDGGVLLNYPIRLMYKYLDPEECMGLYLTGADDQANHDSSIPSRPVKNHVEYLESIAETWRNLAMKQYINDDDWNRTCCIQTKVNATNFDLSDSDRAQLLKEGTDAIQSFIAKFQH